MPLVGELTLRITGVDQSQADSSLVWSRRAIRYRGSPLADAGTICKVLMVTTKEGSWRGIHVSI